MRLRPTRAQDERPRTDIFPALSRGLFSFSEGEGQSRGHVARAKASVRGGRWAAPTPRREAVADRHALQRPCLQAWAETWCGAPLHRARNRHGESGGRCDPLIVCCHARLCTWQQIETGGGAALQQPVRTTGCLVAVPGQRRPPGATGRGMREFVPTFPNVVESKPQLKQCLNRMQTIGDHGENAPVDHACRLGETTPHLHRRRVLAAHGCAAIDRN